MIILKQLKQQLTHQLDCIIPQGEFSEIKVEIQLKEYWPLLFWLKAQPLFPHYFWQHREDLQTIVAIGQIHFFNHLDEVAQFSQCYPFPLVGGVTFEGDCHFILPRFLLIKKGDDLTACLYLRNHIWAQEKQICQTLLSTLDCMGEVSIPALGISKIACAYDFPQWEKTVNNAIHTISQQQLQKVVLANKICLETTQALSPYDLLSISQQKNVGCYHFLWAESRAQAFVGSSPECLYQRNGNQLYTEALAGTASVSEDENITKHYAHWLLHDPKNIYENQLVVDDICQRLQPLITSINVASRKIKQLNRIQHLRCQITAWLKENVRDVDCLIQLHPTAAVAGMPRDVARQFIQQCEPFKRGWYAGALGFLSQTQAEFCVGIRSADIQSQRIALYAGAGMVEGSKAKSEWDEIMRKSLAIGALIGLDTIML